MANLPASSAVEFSTSPLPTQQNELSSSHRLPTVSASQALQSLSNDKSSGISSGQRSLDALFSGANLSKPDHAFERGKVTELWGPAGAGKTAIALQAAATCLQKGEHVIWLDSSTLLDGARISSALAFAKAIDPIEVGTQSLKDFHHISLPSLSHLLALIIQPGPAFVSQSTALLVLDDLNILLDHDYPRVRPVKTNAKPENARWAASRRYAVLGSIGTALRKLAALSSIAIIVTTSCATRGRQDRMGAALVPGIGGSDEWENAISNRAVVFRDYGLRFVGLQKRHGQSTIVQNTDSVGEVGQVCAFAIANDGTLREHWPLSSSTLAGGNGGALLQGTRVEKMSSPIKPRKRMHHEIADSEDEDIDEYGWQEEDDDDVIAAEGLIGEIQPVEKETGDSNAHENG